MLGNNLSGHPLAYVVDDEIIVQKTVRLLLERANYSVRAFYSAEEFAAEMVVVDQPHLLVVDHHLPGITGIELVNRHRDAGQPFEAIIMTGSTDVDAAIAAVRLGIYSYLTKPFAVDQLMNDVAGASQRLNRRITGQHPSIIGTGSSPVLSNFQGPLSSVGSYIEAAARSLSSHREAEATAADLDQARRCLNDAARLVDDGLMRARLEADSRPLVLIGTPFVHCLRSTSHELLGLAQAQRRPIWLEVNQIDPDVEVLAERSVLDRLLRTLISFALRHGPAKAPVVLDVDTNSEMVILHVVSQEDRSADEHTQPPFSDETLAFCSELAGALGGQLTVSAYLDMGTDYALFLRINEFPAAKTRPLVHLA